VGTNGWPHDGDVGTNGWPHDGDVGTNGWPHDWHAGHRPSPLDLLRQTTLGAITPAQKRFAEVATECLSAVQAGDLLVPTSDCSWSVPFETFARSMAHIQMGVLQINGVGVLVHSAAPQRPPLPTLPNGRTSKSAQAFKSAHTSAMSATSAKSAKSPFVTIFVSCVGA
jgi:hypothetical protein